MTKLNLKPILNDARLFVSKRSPEILTGIGIAGMITTTIVAVKATHRTPLKEHDKANTGTVNRTE